MEMETCCTFFFLLSPRPLEWTISTDWKKKESSEQQKHNTHLPHHFLRSLSYSNSLGFRCLIGVQPPQCTTSQEHFFLYTPLLRTPALFLLPYYIILQLYYYFYYIKIIINNNTNIKKNLLRAAAARKKKIIII